MASFDPTFDFSDVTACENFVRQCTLRGEVCDFFEIAGGPGDVKARIRASFLRDLLLGIDLHGRVLAPGVRIVGARIDGYLDLADTAGPTGGVAALTLEQCDIPEPINLAGARIARFSIAFSRFRIVFANGLKCDGDFIFQGARPMPPSASRTDPVPGNSLSPLDRLAVDAEEGDAQIYLNNARIDGAMRGDHSRLSAPLEDGDYDALIAENLKVEGAILLRDCNFTGSVWLLGAEIGGNFAAHGARFTSGSEKSVAINLGMAVIKGGVHLGTSLSAPQHGQERAQCVLNGPLNLADAQISAALLMQGVKFQVFRNWAITAANCQVGGDVAFTSVKLPESNDWHVAFANGGLHFDGARIGGGFFMQGARVEAPNTAGLSLYNAELGEDLVVGCIEEKRCEFSSFLLITGALIHGACVILGVRFEQGWWTCINAQNIRVGENLILAGHQVDNSTYYPLSAFACIWLRGAHIGGSFNCQGLEIRADGGYAMLADSIVVEESVKVSAFSGSQTILDGLVTFEDARINGNLDICNAVISTKGDTAFSANGAQIGGSLAIGLERTITPTASIAPKNPVVEFKGALALQRLKVEGDAAITSTSIRAPNLRALDLESARVAGQFEAFANAIIGRVVLARGKIGQLRDDPQTGWGVDAQIDMNEFLYEQISAPRQLQVQDAPDTTKKPRSDAHAYRHRIAWLRRNCDDTAGDDFSPQPWRQCAVALERGGHYREARYIAFEGQKVENQNRLRKQPFRAFFVWLAEILFGYGLKPKRAGVTLVCCLLIGWLGVIAMQHRGALVLSAPEQSAALMSDGPQATPIRCINEVSPLVYAVDLMVPLLDLQQESTCEPGAAADANLFAGVRAESVPALGTTPLSDWVFFDEVNVWRALKALYAILSAVIVSFALLTFSGVFRPKARDQ